MFVNFYELLGIPEDSDTETIRRAYLRAIREEHPDLTADDVRGESRARQLNSARDTLTDPKLREKHDAHVRALRQRQETQRQAEAQRQEAARRQQQAAAEACPIAIAVERRPKEMEWLGQR